MKEKENVFVSRLEVPRMRRFKSRDKPRDVAKEMAEAVRGDDEDAFRRSSLTMRSPTNVGARAVGQETAAPPDVLRTGDLELIPVTQVERLDAVAANGVRERRVSTPLETVGKGEDPTMVVEESTLVEEGRGDERGLLDRLRPR